MSKLLELFCDVDDFCQRFLLWWHRQQSHVGEKQRLKALSLFSSGVMSILIHFHQSHYRELKSYFRDDVSRHLRAEFPQ